MKKKISPYWDLNSDLSAEREKEWPFIEQMLYEYKPLKKAMVPIRDYYLRGKMPNWKSLNLWSNDCGHLDIFILLWLHPSWDPDVLIEVRDAFLESNCVLYRDVAVGYKLFLLSQTLFISRPVASMQELRFPYLKGKGRVLFDVMFGDLEGRKYNFLEYPSEFVNPVKVFEIPCGRYVELCFVGAWLRLEKMYPVHQDMLFQHDSVLEWWYSGVSKSPDYFKQPRNRWVDVRESYIEALEAIVNFDVNLEGESSVRSSTVLKLKKMLDEKEFAPEIKNAWIEAKHKC